MIGSRISLAIAALCGAVYGLALARWLFEFQPRTFAVFTTWPGALATAVVCAAAVAFIAHRFPHQPFAPVALLLPFISLLSPEVNLLRAQTLLVGSAALFAALTLQALRADYFLLDSGASHPQKRVSKHGRWIPAFAGMTDSKSYFPPFLLFLALLTLYTLTLSPVVGEADAFEFQVNVARLGVSHGNGYPLLMVVGKLFELLPIGGTQAWRVNLSAAVAAAVAAVGVFAIARRLGVTTLLAWLAAFAFGVAPSLWARAVEIEAYALNAALMAMMLWLGLTVLQETGVRSQKSAWLLCALAFIFGLSLTNHLTSILLAPTLGFVMVIWLWLVIRNAKHAIRTTFHVSLLTLLFFLLGLSVYLYIPVRWPAINNGEWLSLQQFDYFLRGGEAAGQFDALLPLKEPQRFTYVFRKITAEFTWMGFGLMMIGVAALAYRATREIRERRETGRAISFVSLVFLLLAYVGHVYFVLAYDPPEPDFSDFFISTYVIAAIFIAVGLQAISHQLSAAGSVLLPSAFLLLPLASIWSTWLRFDYSAAQQRHELGQYALSHPLAPNAALLADPKRYAAPYYLQQAEGVRPDLDIVVLPDEVSYRTALDERLAAGQRVYLARYLAGLGSGYSLRSIGLLAEVSPQPFMTPATPQYLLNELIAEDIRLIGYDRSDTEHAIRMTLHWHVAQTPSQHLAVYLRLRDSQAATVWQSAGSVPVNGLYPTNAWRAGEYVSDYHALPLAKSLPPGAYQLQAGLFPPFQPQAEAGWADVTSIDVAPRVEPVTIPHPLRAQFGDQWLLGYDAPETALPDSPVSVTLYWLRGDSDSVTAFGETRSLAGWPASAIVPMEYALQTPASGETFVTSVATGSPARCGWLAGETADCSLPP
ncbi:MAG: protein O-mannosyl-transferase family, partial [Anaerolineales bacterium]